ncbi:MAG TPA: HAMP domain-containing sensor histidine kinase [Nitrospiria bacterium]|nr:HAMP domain-containing sensor histidine kinase [Nitrospiria bacterium]
MNIPLPKSVLRLILVGFLLVTLPLAFALLNATLYVDRLAGQGQNAILQAVQATKESSLMLEQVTAMERSAKQYLVLGDATLFGVYETTHDAFQASAKKLFTLPLEEAQWRILKELVEKEQDLYTVLRDHPYNSDVSVAAVSGFEKLRDLAAFIVAERGRLIDQEMGTMQHTAGKAMRILTWQLIAVAPVVVGLVVVFAVLISRPIRRINEAIRRLGDGEFAAPITISGPHDLEDLGRRLDWLRLRLIDLEEQKKKFLDHVSHELKTPLSSIREGSELLMDEIAGPLTDAQRKVVGILRQNSVHLQRVIEQLVNFRAVLLRHAALYLREFRLDRVIEKVAADHGLAMMAKNIKLELSLADLSVYGDEEKVTAIVDNLISNAVKFSPYEGLVRIKLSSQEGLAVLEVIDSGPGIASEERDKVFEPFYQGRITPNGYVKGTGIGLSVVAEYVKLHSGTIQVIDEQVGARFRVSLPVQSG